MYIYTLTDPSRPHRKFNRDEIIETLMCGEIYTSRAEAEKYTYEPYSKVLKLKLTPVKGGRD